MEYLLEYLIGLVAIVLAFSVPLSAIWTTHLRKSQNIRAALIKDEIELEKLKYDNFLLETEKMRVELQQKQASLLETTSDPILIDLQKRTNKETNLSSI